MGGRAGLATGQLPLLARHRGYIVMKFLSSTTPVCAATSNYYERLFRNGGVSDTAIVGPGPPGLGSAGSTGDEKCGL